MTMPHEPGASKPRIGPRMREIADFAAAVPGGACRMRSALPASPRGTAAGRVPRYTGPKLPG